MRMQSGKFGIFMLQSWLDNQNKYKIQIGDDYYMKNDSQSINDILISIFKSVVKKQCEEVNK